MKETTDWGFTFYPELTLPDGTVIDGPPVHNRIPNEGIDHLTGLFLGTSPLISAWHVGLFEKNYVPVAETKAVDLPLLVGECTAYESATRPLWTPDTVGGGVIDNMVNRSSFEFVSDKRLYGGFLASSSDKASGTGLLFSIARFNSPIDVTAGSTLRLRIATVFVTS